MAGGRPTKRTAKVTAEICERLAGGESLRAICRDAHMPSWRTVLAWVLKDDEFHQHYARARSAQAELWADELMDIADDGSNDWMERNDGDNPGYATNGEAINRSRLRVDTRKWVMSRLLAKKYGDRLQHTGGDGGPITVKITNYKPE